MLLCFRLVLGKLFVAEGIPQMVFNFVVKHSNNVKTNKNFFNKKRRHLTALEHHQPGQRCRSICIG